MNEVIDRLLVAQEELAQRPVDQILAVLSRTTDRWLDHADPIRREAEEALTASTGLAPAMLRRGLDEMMGRLYQMADLLDCDLGSRYALDSFVQRGDTMRSRAWGPRLLVYIFSGNVPGIPAFDMALALALKSACLARPAQQEPHFAALFARSVSEADELLGRALAVHGWPYDEDLPLRRADAVVAYGSDESIAAIRRRLPPGQRFIAHGHKIGLAVVAREAATAATARLLAEDVAMYDQQGCVSPHIAFIERGGSLAPSAFASACGEALADLQRVMPRAKLTTAEAMALRAAHDEALFGADACYRSAQDLAWAVVHSEAPVLVPSPLNRLLRTCAIDALDAVAVAVAPMGIYLQTIGFAGPDDRRLALAHALGRLGASRICPIGFAQRPDARLHHDGRPVAGDLVRWTDIERGGDDAR